MHSRGWRVAYFQGPEPDVAGGEERELGKGRHSVDSLGVLHSEDLDLDPSSHFHFLLRPGLWPRGPSQWHLAWIIFNLPSSVFHNYFQE